VLEWFGAFEPLNLSAYLKGRFAATAAQARIVQKLYV
jgi:hypothetical protein